MYILLDIGNTNIGVGLYDGKALLDSWRLRSDQKKTADEYYSLLQSLLATHNIAFKQVKDLIISSVVPKLTQTFTWLWTDRRNQLPFVIHAKLKTGVHVETDEIGSDLLVAAVAAYHKYHENCIILDMGTATTVTGIKADGTISGVSIISGLELTVNALLNNTALLSFTNNIDPTNVKAMGTTTETAIQSGIVFGYTGLVDNIIANFIKEMNVDSYKVITTGGQAQIIANFSQYIEKVDPDLLFDGMKIIYELNKGGF